MGYQFVHLESYSRKADNKGRSVDFIFAEATRKPEASIHVSNPSPPIVVFGVGVDEVRDTHDTVVAAAVVEVKGGKTRKLRTDQKTLHTIVASHPYAMDEIRADLSKRRRAEEWERRTIEWLKDQYGDDLKCVVRHEDESHYHIHAYVLPLSDPTLKATRYHPGANAKKAVMEAGAASDEDQKALGKRADAAYKAAMRQWQDTYHQQVAIPSGLTRLGPKRRRLTREEWQAEKSQAKALQKAVEQAQKVKSDGEAYINRTKLTVAKIQAQTARKIADANRATATALAAQDRARQERAQAQQALSDARKYTGFGGRLRALWDGLKKSRLLERFWQEIQPEIDRWKQTVENSKERLKNEERRRRDAERWAHEAERQAEKARDEAARVGVERDRLRSILQPQGSRDRDVPGPAKGPALTLKPRQRDEQKAR
jgi:hypothetical protein